MVRQKPCALDAAHRNRAMIGILLAFTFFVAEHVLEQKRLTLWNEYEPNQPTIDWGKTAKWEKQRAKHHKNTFQFNLLYVCFFAFF